VAEDEGGGTQFVTLSACAPAVGGAATIGVAVEDDDATQGDGVVDGTPGDDDMDLGYTDPDGDQITDGDDVVVGDAGNDDISGGDGSDTLSGGLGDDDITVGAGDVASGDEGDDEFYVDPNLTGSDPITIVGGELLEEDVIDPTNNPDGRVGDVLDLRGLTDVVVTYDPTDALRETGTATFTNTDGETVTINFSEIEIVLTDGINRPPNAEDDILGQPGVTNENQAPEDLGRILANDTDPDGDTLVVSAVNGSAGSVGVSVMGSNGGLVTIFENGQVNFDANGQFDYLGFGESANTTVTYTTRDPGGLEDTATVTIVVKGLDFGPDATNNVYAVLETETSGDVDGNVITDDTGDGVDSDSDGPIEDLTVVAVNGDAGNVGIAVAGSGGGLFTIQASGVFDFDANGEFADGGSTGVSYTIEDAAGLTSSANVTVNVQDDGAVSNSLIARDDFQLFMLTNLDDVQAIATGLEATVSILFNDEDPDGDVFFIRSVGSDTTTDADGWFDWQVADQGGEIRANSDGRFEFRDVNGSFDYEALSGTSIDYSIEDAAGTVTSALITVDLMAVSYTHLRAHETVLDLVCRLLLEKK